MCEILFDLVWNNEIVPGRWNEDLIYSYFFRKEISKTLVIVEA